MVKILTSLLTAKSWSNNVRNSILRSKSFKILPISLEHFYHQSISLIRSRVPRGKKSSKKCAKSRKFESDRKYLVYQSSILSSWTRDRVNVRVQTTVTLSYRLGFGNLLPESFEIFLIFSNLFFQRYKLRLQRKRWSLQRWCFVQSIVRSSRLKAEYGHYHMQMWE